MTPAWTTTSLPTPFYLIDESALLTNMQRIAHLRELSGAKALLALKCFSTWSVFPLMRQYMDGTTSSSLNEARLGKEKFGGETHAYSVAYADHEIDAVIENSDKVIFNSISQLQRYADKVRIASKPIGLRINPGVSNSPYLLADPARPNSRLGTTDPACVTAVLDQLDGLMFHNNCENKSFASFNSMLESIEARFSHILKQVNWVSLGGGIHFCAPDFPLDEFAARLKKFSELYGVQVYLEPGEASITNSASLHVSVLDITFNGKPLAIVDSSTEAHMLDLLIYQQNARIEPNQGDFNYLVCGKTCLAGDIFGEFRFAHELQIGDRIEFKDAAGYTMVKKNWFNGVAMPTIAVRRINGAIEVVRDFSYQDFVAALS